MPCLLPNTMNIIAKSLSITLTFVCVLLVSIGNCQPPDGDGGGEDPDVAIPIDGGVGFLATAGVAYGVTVLMKKKKSKE